MELQVFLQMQTKLLYNIMLYLSGFLYAIMNC